MSEQTTYVCGSCGASGIKLWRPYNSFHVELRCAVCAAREQNEDISTMGADGSHQTEFGNIDQIGSMVPAVPTGEPDAYWGYASVPEDRVTWWKALPTFVPARPDASVLDEIERALERIERYALDSQKVALGNNGQRSSINSIRFGQIASMASGVMSVTRAAALLREHDAPDGHDESEVTT